MGLIRPSVLLLATAMSAPAMYRFVYDEVDVTELMTRFLIAVPIAVVMVAMFRMVTSGYGREARRPLDLQGAQPAPVVQPEPLHDATE
jgi:Flp pilus assembly pilin Flp